MMQTSVKERRQWRRRTLATTVLFRTVHAGGPFRSGQMRDISQGGVAFDTDDPPFEGDVVDMFFKENALAADQRVRGRVVWVRSAESGMAGVGVSFVD
jgi:Tfp pilus assembly protein PilZ